VVAVSVVAGVVSGLVVVGGIDSVVAGVVTVSVG
jgi:hypothetical protein